MEIRNATCQHKLMAARDALDAIRGTWRIPIIISLLDGKKRFGEIRHDIKDISPKMLSKELKDLELNGLITRTVYDSMPLKVEYSLTFLGKSLNKLMEELLEWGFHLRSETAKK